MKRKTVPPAEPIVTGELLDAATPLIADAVKVVPAVKCTVCGGEGAPNSTEGLCWVCRRLKISAWRDADPQMTAQE